MTQHEIRGFFAQRPWLRPTDWGEIDGESMPKRRQDELTIWIKGYLTAKSDYPEPPEALCPAN